MGKSLSFLLVFFALLLSGQPLESQEFPFSGSEAYQALLRAAYSRLGRFATLLIPSKIPFLADGGGDGGGSGDGAGTGDGGDGSSSGGDSGDGDSSTGDSTNASAAATSDAASADAAATDSASADAAATDAAATDAATADAAAVDNATVADPTGPTTENNTDPVAFAPTDPTTPTVTPELAAIMSIPTTDPRGGEALAALANNGAPPGAAPPISGPGTLPVDVAINAVIVSAAQSPWDAVRRAPGVRNVIVTGGIVALGETPIPGEMPGGGPQPAWLRVIPDLRLLNGSIIPPVVPNVIDIRIMDCPIKIENSPE